MRAPKKTYRVIAVLPDGSRVLLKGRMTLRTAERFMQDVLLSTALPDVEIESEEIESEESDGTPQTVPKRPPDNP